VAEDQIETHKHLTGLQKIVFLFFFPFSFLLVWFLMQPRRAREDKTADPNKQERQAFCQTMRHQLQLVKTNADYKALSSLIEEEIRRVR